MGPRARRVVRKGLGGLGGVVMLLVCQYRRERTTRMETKAENRKQLSVPSTQSRFPFSSFYPDTMRL